MNRQIIFLLTFPILLFWGCNNEHSTSNTNEHATAEVNFKSSDPELNAAWRWAKSKSLSYVRSGDPVGVWYEAALPGRDAFCMRDVAHMVSGAAILGLNEENKNMLYRFAENISESKDWCSFWEINKDNLPAPVDYRYEKDFWYNLPANFDIVDACFRLYLWTGDSTYISDPVFKDFYSNTLVEYVERWDLSADRILHRDRIMNLPEAATPENHNYFYTRGIPGYHEGAGGRMQLGIDLLATQYAANIWYHYYMSDDPGNSIWLDEAKKIKNLIEDVFWDADSGHFKSLRYEDGSMEHRSGTETDLSHSTLHYNAIDKPEMIASILDAYGKNKEGYSIEIASHLPDIFFRNNRPDDGVHMLKYLTKNTTVRRDYPENPFAVVGAFVTGLMGVTAGAPDNYISTFSRFTDPTSQAKLSGLPVIGKKIDLLHRGRHTSMVHNHSDEAFFWKPYLLGKRESWFINGKEEKSYGKEFVYDGQYVTSFLIRVEPHTSVSVSAYPPPEQENAK